ncbi:MAG: hypothetical protein IIU82_04950, partial [Tidjanibacter sp.]|nr:hypothetical protein [Tidjanibacter sp.]
NNERIFKLLKFTKLLKLPIGLIRLIGPIIVSPIGPIGLIGFNQISHNSQIKNLRVVRYYSQV